MRLILSDRKIKSERIGNDIKIQKININTLKNFDNNSNVVAIVGSRAIAKKAINMKLPNLRLFQLTSAGFDGVPILKYREKNIDVCNAGAVYSNPIAETVVYGMLQIAKKYWKNPNNHIFRPFRKYKYITELDSKRVLIMGCGNIGTAIAKRLIGFNMSIDGYDPYCEKKNEYIYIIRNRDTLINKINQYDYIISTLPDTKETNGFIDKSVLNNMSPNAVIINVGRKTVFNEKDLYQILKSKKIKGAVLDMFQKVPNPITNKFRRLKNTIVMPGVSAISQEVNINLTNVILDNLVKVLNNDEPKYIINKRR
ncbi:NAD(P)-dependent oxidoreductase [Thomasclavelia spiroformis]|uniref:NAD(P)-dependent oxidoreductase n=1 Tax=Thomasclavelia spiroformis TaxID=29348 RepID=UPI000B3A3945|nr:NAD(P)-dependent oxidoreductase [Thomasclavelia spiroformis]OUO70297.1 hypothetical protein B5F64_06500 [Thomasclavelia spiroformis]